MDNQNITAPITDLQQRFKQTLLRLPALAGNEVVNFALDNFKRQAFLGDTMQPWRKRKNPTKWGQTPKRNARNILIDTGKLRRSIRVVRVENDTVVVGSDDPKARTHNEGVRLGQIQKVKSFKRVHREFTTGSAMSIKSRKSIKPVKVKTEVTVKAHTRRVDQNIPARPFLKQSQYLTKRLERLTVSELMKAMKG